MERCSMSMKEGTRYTRPPLYIRNNNEHVPLCRYDFQLKEDDEKNQYIIEVAIPRYIYMYVYIICTIT